MTVIEKPGRPAKVLTDAQRQSFLETGYLCLPGFVGAEWMERLETATAAQVEESRSVAETNNKFDLEAGHSADDPRLRRLMTPQDHDPVFWEFTSKGPIVDVAEDLLGPNLKFHHGKLNFKWASGGAEVKWHQDIPFWPHTAYNVVTIGVALTEIDDEMGPMGVVPGSHTGPIYDHFGERKKWRGFIDDKDLPDIAIDKAEYLKGPAGTVTVHHCRAVHGSEPNRHPTRPRPFLLNAYSSADCLPLMPPNQKSRYSGTVVRGEHPDYPTFDPEPCRLPPMPTETYRSIFAAQQGER